MALGDLNSILALQKILDEASGHQDSDSDDDFKPKTGAASLGPGDLGPKETTPTKNVEAAQKKITKDIWDEDEVQTGQEYDDVYDNRPQPEYDINYQQSVSTEDMFLQMGNKTPSTASCEAMVVKIKLPNTKLEDVKLDCTNQFVDCRTPKYKLGLHLPHPVDGKNGKAQWDGKTQTLSIRLRMMREFDFMNF